MPFHKVISDKQKAISIIKTYLLSLISYHFKVKHGFTLVELLIAISVVSIVSSLAYANFNSAQDSARDSRRKQDLKAIKTALVSYYQDYQAYPPPCNPSPCTSGAQFLSDGGGTWIPGLTPTYIKSLPKDPKQAGLITQLAGLIPKFAGKATPQFSQPQGQVAAATTVTIGTGTLTNVFPLDVNYQYPCDISLYTAAEIGMAGNITNVSWYRGDANSDAIDGLYIYMKHTTLTNLNSTSIDTCNEATSGATQTYSNAAEPNLDGTTTGWYPSKSLTTPFAYNGTNNLVVVVKTVTVPYEESYSQYRYSSSTSNHRYCESDTSGDCDTGVAALNSNRPNIQLEITPSNTVPTITGNPVARDRKSKRLNSNHSQLS